MIEWTNQCLLYAMVAIFLLLGLGPRLSIRADPLPATSGKVFFVDLVLENTSCVLKVFEKDGRLTVEHLAREDGLKSRQVATDAGQDAAATRNDLKQQTDFQYSYDHQGAMWFAVSVIAIYGLSIALLIGSTLRRNETDYEVKGFLRSYAKLDMYHKKSEKILVKQKLRRMHSALKRLENKRRLGGVSASGGSTASGKGPKKRSRFSALKMALFPARESRLDSQQWRRRRSHFEEAVEGSEPIAGGSTCLTVIQEMPLTASYHSLDRLHVHATNVYRRGSRRIHQELAAAAATSDTDDKARDEEEDDDDEEDEDEEDFAESSSVVSVASV